ncbi:MAG: hypothetical protein U0414_28915 [Polyangiaceae bacterium]
MNRAGGARENPRDASESARLYVRQVLVLGVDGQAGIERGAAAVGGPGRAAEIAALYAARAGFASIVDGELDRDRFAPAHALGSEVARDVLAASRAVLREMLAAAGGVPG